MTSPPKPPAIVVELAVESSPRIRVVGISSPADLERLADWIAGSCDRAQIALLAKVVELADAPTWNDREAARRLLAALADADEGDGAP